MRFGFLERAWSRVEFLAWIHCCPDSQTRVVPEAIRPWLDYPVLASYHSDSVAICRRVVARAKHDVFHETPSAAVLATMWERVRTRFDTDLVAVRSDLVEEALFP